MRRRELNIPWRELMLQAPRLGDSPKRDDQARLKGYFERCWDAARVKYAGTAFEQAKGQAWDNTPCWDEKGEKVDANFVLLHQPSKRRYVLVDPAARPIMFDPQTGGPDPWNAFWNTHRISGSFQVFSSKDESASARSGALYVSREVLSIRDEYRGLMSRQAFATKLGQVAEQRLLAMSGEVWWEDPTQADADLQKFQAFKSVTHKVEQAKRALKERASRLGYVLATSDQEISLPDGTK
ncbi:MAG TPA: hypothetical protein VEB43_06120, partial [Anaeromyxobacter sp.]|nr:hypothetical protein [Anaeromyxobacter sp.]